MASPVAISVGSTSSTVAPLKPCRPASLQFYLPVFPVPLHACFKNVGSGKFRRAPTGRYVTYQRTVDAFLRQFDLGLFVGPVRVHYVISRPDKRRRDLDNLLKCLNDTLTRCHVLGDDSQIVDLRIGWTLEKLEHPVLVQIQEAS